MSDLLEQKKLRQVNIQSGPIEAASEYMSMGNLEDFMQQKQEMEKAIPIENVPNEKTVIEAHKEVGLSLRPGSLKHPQRVIRAGEKWKLQGNLIAKSRNKPELDPEELKNVRAHFADFDAAKLLHAEDKKNTYETLLAHYDEIKTELSYVDEFDKQIAESREEVSDEERAKLATLKDVKAFYNLHERLMTNKYYVMLPHDEMHKLSYDELRKRLDNLYAEDSKNEELINYYQDLIRLKQLGLSDTKSVNARQTEYLDQLQHKTEKKQQEAEEKKDPVKEMKNIQSTFTKLKKSLKPDDNNLIFEGTESRLLSDFFRIYGADLEKYRDSLTEKDLKAKADYTLEAILAEYQSYKDNKEKKADNTADDKANAILKKTEDDEGDAIGEDDGESVEGITLTKEQISFCNAVDKQLFEKALSDDQLPFGTTLLNIKTEERLLIYYMIENKKTAATLNGDDFFAAMKNYVPSPEVIKKNANWKNLSAALRTYKPAFKDIVEFGKLDEASKQATEQAANELKEKKSEQGGGDAIRAAQQKQNSLSDAIQKKLSLVSMLYKKAGLAPKMPPDMARDPILRKRLVTECNSLMGMGVALDALSQSIKKAKDAEGAPKGSGVSPDELDDSIESEIAIETIFKADELVGGIMTAGATFENARMGAAYLSSAYQGFSNMKDGLLSIVGFLGAIAGAVTIAKDATLSAADRTAQALSTGSTFAVTSAGAANAFYGFSINGIAEESLSATQKLTQDTLGNVLGGVMVAAGAIQIATSSIQLARAVSSEKDVKKARDLLAQKKEADKAKEEKELKDEKKDRKKLSQKTELTKDEKILSRFLRHQDNEITRKQANAGLDMVSGGVMAATGALMLAGAAFAPALAILAFVGIGVAVMKLATNCSMKKQNREAAVDDFLRVDDKLKEIIALKKDQAAQNGKEAKINEKKLRAAVRKEALAKLGYSNYMDCYRFIVAQAAELLYNKNFVNVPTDETEKQMYAAALDSLGLKKSKKKVQGEEPRPTGDEIYAKLLAAA